MLGSDGCLNCIFFTLPILMIHLYAIAYLFQLIFLLELLNVFIGLQT